MSHDAGFTLVELLIAMTILVIVTASTMLVFRGVTKAWRSGELKTERYQQARLIFDLFSRELSSCVANPRYPFIGQPTGASPLKTGSTQAAIFFVGALPGRGGLVERGYWVTADGTLMCHDEEPADGDYATGTDELCGVDVGELVAAYFDGADWQAAWDGRSGAAQDGLVPRAIRLTLSVGRPNPERFETIIHVPTSESAE